jgi:tRNA pseudouridine38-40 synthase
MRNFKLTLEYDGSQFCGWQIQNKGERTVQGEFEVILEKIFKQPIKAIASGRTDSGVHAAGQVVNFSTVTRMTPLEIQKALNALLPQDIAIIAALEVKNDFHAQYSVIEKTYRYTILNRPYRSATLRNTAYFYPHALNSLLMRKGAKYFLGRQDFKSFQAHDPLRAERDTIRTIKDLTVKKEGELIHIDITANGFLYKMVRNITGTLIDVGTGQLAPESIRKIINAKSRTEAGKTAPAHGLSLLSVKY